MLDDACVRLQPAGEMQYMRVRYVTGRGVVVSEGKSSGSG